MRQFIRAPMLDRHDHSEGPDIAFLASDIVSLEKQLVPTGVVGEAPLNCTLISFKSRVPVVVVRDSLAIEAEMQNIEEGIV